MIRPLLAITSFIYSLLQRYAPSNIVLRWIRSRRGLKRGVPAMLLALPCSSPCHTSALHFGAHLWQLVAAQDG